MHDRKEIQDAIARLPPHERAQILLWLTDMADQLDCVQETAALYDVEVMQRRFTAEEYLAHEEQTSLRHEYVDGMLHAMAGASESHERVTVNILAAVHAHIRGGPCTAYSQGFKVYVKKDVKEIFYYPDVMVACTRHGVERLFLRYPALIFEVLSPSTRSVDRREKLLNYTNIPTVEEYVLVNQDSPEVIIHRREDNWQPRWVCGPERQLKLKSIELSLPFSQIYEGVIFAEPVSA